MKQSAQLGLGLIGIGKKWGYVSPEVPSEKEVLELLDFAVSLGIRYLDTAPSYGVSEERLGKFLNSLTASERNGLTIATKFGEHWDPLRGEPYVDHSYDALKRSLDGSLERLGRIDILQLHKTTPAVLASKDLARAWDYAESLGIQSLGASISDPASAAATIADQRFKVIQLPLNLDRRDFSPMVTAAAGRGMWVAINRPYAMGAMLYGEKPVLKKTAFEFILGHGFRGVVLTGTTDRKHLQENWEAFEEAAQTF